jgi:hypothetical protein
MQDKILTIKKSTLVDIANQIREKNGSTDLIKVADLDDAVKELSGGADYPVAEYSVHIQNTLASGTIYYSLDLGKTWLTLDAESEVDVTTMYGITSGIGAAAFEEPIPVTPASIVLIGIAGSMDDLGNLLNELQIDVTSSGFGNTSYYSKRAVCSVSSPDYAEEGVEIIYAIPVIGNGGISVGFMPS